MSGRVLAVSSDEALRTGLQEACGEAGIELEVVARSAQALSRLEDVGVVLLDLSLDGTERGAVVEALRERVDLPLLVIPAAGETATVQTCERLGAHDFIERRLDQARLTVSLQRALEWRTLNQRVRTLTRDPEGGRQGPESIRPFAEEERRIILRALESTRWNVQEAATRLRIGRATIYRKIDRYGLRKAAGRV